MNPIDDSLLVKRELSTVYVGSTLSVPSGWGDWRRLHQKADYKTPGDSMGVKMVTNW